MSEQHEPTFEVGPIEAVEGIPVRLVYTRMEDRPTPEHLRVVALQSAVQSEQFTFRKEDRDADETPDKARHVVETAMAFLAFLERGYL